MQPDCGGYWNCQLLSSRLSIDQEKATSMPIAYPQIPGDFQKYMNSCTQTISNHEFSSTASHVSSANNGDAIWMLWITSQPDILETDKYHLPNRENTNQIKAVDIAAAQRADGVISRVYSSQMERRNQPWTSGNTSNQRWGNIFESGISYTWTTILASYTVTSRLYFRLSFDDWSTGNSTRTWDILVLNACSL